MFTFITTLVITGALVVPLCRPPVDRVLNATQSDLAWVAKKIKDWADKEEEPVKENKPTL